MVILNVYFVLILFSFSYFDMHEDLFGHPLLFTIVLIVRVLISVSAMTPQDINQCSCE